MRVWIARGDPAQEVGVLRVTLSPGSISTGLRSITQPIQRTG